MSSLFKYYTLFITYFFLTYIGSHGFSMAFIFENKLNNQVAFLLVRPNTISEEEWDEAKKVQNNFGMYKYADVDVNPDSTVYRRAYPAQEKGPWQPSTVFYEGEDGLVKYEVRIVTSAVPYKTETIECASGLPFNLKTEGKIRVSLHGDSYFCTTLK